MKLFVKLIRLVAVVCFASVMLKWNFMVAIIGLVASSMSLGIMIGESNKGGENT